jgi:hypothetical protein
MGLLDRHFVLHAPRFDQLAVGVVQVRDSLAGGVGLANGAGGSRDDLVSFAATSWTIARSTP